MNSSCCREAPDCEPGLCRCTCPRCNKTKTPNLLKASVTAAVAISVLSGGAKKKRARGSYSYKWPGSSDEGSISSASSFSSLSRQYSNTSTSSLSSTPSECSSPGTPGSSMNGFPMTEPKSPFSPSFGKKNPFVDL